MSKERSQATDPSIQHRDKPTSKWKRSMSEPVLDIPEDVHAGSSSSDDSKILQACEHMQKIAIKDDYIHTDTLDSSCEVCRRYLSNKVSQCVCAIFLV